MKPEQGIGVDVVSVKRFSAKINLDRKSLGKWFSLKEIEYCFSKTNPSLHLSGRFAAKEAVIKALSQKNGSILGLHQVEILGDGKSAPKVKVSPEICKDYKILVSISHDADIAIAFSIVSDR